MLQYSWLHCIWCSVMTLAWIVSESGTQTEPSRFAVTLSLMRTPTTGWCVSWRTRCHAWKSSSMPRAWVTSLKVRLSTLSAWHTLFSFMSLYKRCVKLLIGNGSVKNYPRCQRLVVIVQVTRLMLLTRNVSLYIPNNFCKFLDSNCNQICWCKLRVKMT